MEFAESIKYASVVAWLRFCSTDTCSAEAPDQQLIAKMDRIGAQVKWGGVIKDSEILPDFKDLLRPFALIL